MMKAQEIRKLRRIAGVTQMRLARLSGITPSQLSLAENELITLKPEALEAIERAIFADFQSRQMEMDRRLSEVGDSR